MFPRTEQAMRLLANTHTARQEMMMDVPLVKRDELNETRVFDEAQNIANILEVSITSKFNKIQRQNYPQNIKLMTTLRSKDLNLRKVRAGLDLVILVDVSSSMSRTKIELAQETLLFVIDQLEEIDRLSIIKFSDDSTILCPLAPMTPDIKQKMKLLVMTKLVCCGNTNIMAGLNDCFQLLEARRMVNEVSSIFLLSDGSDTAGNKLEGFGAYLDKMAQKLLPKGMDFQINSFGFGIDHDEDVLSLMAKKQQGAFYYIKDLKRIDECFIDCLSKLMSIYAKNVQVDIFLNGGVTFAKKYGPFWDQTVGNQAKGTLIIRSLKGGSEMGFLAELTVPPVGPDPVLKVAVAILNFNDGGSSAVISKELRLEVVNDSNLGPFDPKVDELLTKFEMAHVLSVAEEKMAQMKRDEAQKLVQDFNNLLVLRSSENPALGARFAQMDLATIAKSKKVSNQARYVLECEQDDAPGFSNLFAAPSANCMKRAMLQKKK